MANNGKAKLSDLIPDDHNANKGTQRGTGVIEDSLRKYGAGRSILVDRNGKIIAGNKTAEAAASIGLENVRIIETDGHEIVAVKRTDLDLDSKEARELAIADNRAGELNLDWDVDALTALEAEGVDLDGLFYEDELQALADSIGDTATDRDGQGVASAWSQVHASESAPVTIGRLQSRVSNDTADALYDFVVSKFEGTAAPIYETLESLLRAGLDALRGS